jgi:hypothetical protein
MKRIFNQIWKELTMPIPGTNIEIEFGGFIFCLFLTLILIYLFGGFSL